MPKETPAIRQIISAASAATGIPVDVIMDPACRSHDVTRVRHVALYVTRTLTHRGWPTITKAFNLKHPTGFLGAQKIAKLLVENDKEVKQLVAKVVQATKPKPKKES